MQTCRRLIDDGLIGKPTGISAFACTHGVERHHPNPDFYYKEGGGPLLDLGPYYLTAMVSLLGPVKRSCGFSRRTFDERMIESQPRHGEMMTVEVDTHVCGMLEFAMAVALRRDGITPPADWLNYPTVEQGAQGVRFIDAAVESHQAGGAWVDCRLKL